MASVKQLLDAFAKSGSTQAFVKKGTAGVTVATFTAPYDWANGVKEYICPADGVLKLDTVDATGWAILGSSSGYLYLSTIPDTAVIRFHGASVPVSKGNTVRLMVFLQSGTTSISTIRFFPCRGQS